MAERSPFFPESDVGAKSTQENKKISAASVSRLQIHSIMVCAPVVAEGHSSQ